MSRKIVVRRASTAWQSLAWSLAMLVAFLLAGCQQTGPTDPCAPNGCTVPAPGDPVYVPLCRDVDAHQGPCVGDMAGTWLYVGPGATFPHGKAVELCATQDGGPFEPCAWVPSRQGNGQGDSGAYVYGVGTVPGYGSGPTED